MDKKYRTNQARNWEDELRFRYDLFASESDEELRMIARAFGIDDCENLTRQELIERISEID